MTRSDIDLAWAIGLFEGEGCFSVHRFFDGRVQIQAKLAMTDRDTVERFARIVGCGHMQRPRVDPRPERKDIHTWVVYEAVLVAELAELFLPMLGERRSAKAREIIEAAKSIGLHPGNRTHCPSGHEYSGDNLGWNKDARTPRSTRYCRACRAEGKKRRALAAVA